MVLIDENGEHMTGEVAYDTFICVLESFQQHSETIVESEASGSQRSTELELLGYKRSSELENEKCRII